MNIQFYAEELAYCCATLHDNAPKAGSFLTHFLRACLWADSENYELLRPMLAVMMLKYPAPKGRLGMERLDNGRANDADVAAIEAELRWPDAGGCVSGDREFCVGYVRGFLERLTDGLADLETIELLPIDDAPEKRVTTLTFVEKRDKDDGR